MRVHVGKPLNTDKPKPQEAVMASQIKKTKRGTGVVKAGNESGPTEQHGKSIMR